MRADGSSVVTEDEECRLRYATVSTLPGSSPEPEKDGQVEEKEQSEKTGEHGASDGVADASTDNPADADVGAENEKHPAEAAGVDPLRMFGILVPPALRSAQASFREAVDGPVVRLAALTGELRALEREIGRTRKSIRKA